MKPYHQVGSANSPVDHQIIGRGTNVFEHDRVNRGGVRSFERSPTSGDCERTFGRVYIQKTIKLS